jgi:putative DNA primase/helicase
LFARFALLIWSDYGEETEVDAPVNERARGEVFSAFRLLNNISTRFETDCMRFSEGGRAAYVAWVNDLTRRFRPGAEHPALVAHCKKYKSLVPSLALIIALVEGEAEDISESAVGRAVLWANYLEQHARRAYGSVTTGGVSAAKLIIEKIRAGCLPPQFTARQVKLKQWGGLAGENVEQALELLAECGWLRATPRKTGGRPTIDYEPNPRAFDGFDKRLDRDIEKL